MHRRSELRADEPLRARKLLMMNPHEFEAVIFDMDGVITQTATLHASP